MCKDLWERLVRFSSADLTGLEALLFASLSFSSKSKRRLLYEKLQSNSKVVGGPSLAEEKMF